MNLRQWSYFWFFPPLLCRDDLQSPFPPRPGNVVVTLLKRKTFLQSSPDSFKTEPPTLALKTFSCRTFHGFVCPCFFPPTFQLITCYHCSLEEVHRCSGLWGTVTCLFLDWSTRRTDQKTMLTLYHCHCRWLLLGRRRQKQLQQMRQQRQAEETAGAVRASSTRNRFSRPTRFDLLLFLFSSLWICGIKLYVQVVHQTSFVKPTRFKVLILS